MPQVASLRTRVEASDVLSDLNNQSVENTSAESRAERIPLFLPSACPASILLLDESKPLVVKEIQLRTAQAYDALAHIKKLRRILVSIATFKHQNVSGTGNRANTRMRSLYDKFQGRIRLAASRYRAAHASLCKLDPSGTWSTQLKVLNDTDIRGPSKDTEDEVLGEGQREHSWIWLVGANIESNEGDSETTEAMRVEWGKTWARAQRWREEVKLLQEEMRRILEYFSWKAAWWRSKAVGMMDTDPATLSGMMAYAEKQAMIMERLREDFSKRWSKVLKKQGIQTEWQKQYDKLPKSTTSTWERRKAVEEIDENDRETESEDSSSGSSDKEVEKENQDSDIEMQDA